MKALKEEVNKLKNDKNTLNKKIKQLEKDAKSGKPKISNDSKLLIFKLLISSSFLERCSFDFLIWS